jgi:hypothetical protein
MPTTTVSTFKFLEGQWFVGYMVYYRPTITIKDLNDLVEYVQYAHPNICISMTRDDIIGFLEHNEKYVTMDTDHIIRRKIAMPEDQFKLYYQWHVPEELWPTIQEFIQLLDSPTYENVMITRRYRRDDTAERAKIVETWENHHVNHSTAPRT